MKWGLLLSLTLLSLAGTMAAVYQVIAERNNWNVGEYFRLNSFMPAIGGLLAFGSIIVSVVVNPWWTGILILILALTFSQLVIMVFKQASQILTLILIVISLLTTYFTF